MFVDDLDESGHNAEVRAGTIPKEVIEEIVRRLVAGLNPEQVILFGSYAHGQPTPESDLDLMILVPQSGEPPHRREQAAYRCVGAVGVSKDLLVLTSEEFERQACVATSLARRVKDKGTVLYERGKTHPDLAMVDQEPT